MPACVLLGYEMHGLNEDKARAQGTRAQPASASPECTPLHILAAEPHMDALLQQ